MRPFLRTTALYFAGAPHCLTPARHLRFNSAMPIRHRYQSEADSYEDRWTAVDAYSFPVVHPASRPNSKLLDDTLRASAAAGLPDYHLSPLQAKFLALHCRTAGVTHVLEVGTLGGYSAIWLASERPQLHVTTIEANRHHVDVARENIKRAGLEQRIEVIHGTGLDVLPRLQQDVRSGRRSPFGLVFIDADKRNNLNYFQLAKTMVRSGSTIVVDNIVREGQLVDLDDRDPSVAGSREVVEKVGKMTDVDAVVLQTVGEKSYDGWLWAVVD